MNAMSYKSGFVAQRILGTWRNTQIIEGYELNLFDIGIQVFLYNLVTSPILLRM